MAELAPWKIELDGHIWTDEDPAGAQIVLLDELLDVKGWDVLTPWSSPRVAMAWTAILLSGTGVDLAEAIDRVNKLTPHEIAALVQDRPVAEPAGSDEVAAA